jgi:hypothetical protein
MPRAVYRLRLHLLPLVLAALLHVPAVHAVSPEEFGALEPEAALRLPVIEALEVFGWRREEFLFVLENALIDLRYLYAAPTGKPSKALTAAIRTYQRETGQPATGVLLVGEFMGLIERGNQFWQAPVYPGPVIYSETAQTVSIEGTWARESGETRDPVQTTSIRCHRAANLCSAVTARLVMGDEEEGWFHTSAMDLALQTREWTVVQWTADRIDAEERSSLCVVQHLTIDTRRQSATLRDEPQADARCQGSAPAPATYRLESGYEIASRYWNARQIRAHQLRSKAFQQLVDRLSKKAAAK